MSRIHILTRNWKKLKTAQLFRNCPFFYRLIAHIRAAELCRPGKEETMGMADMFSKEDRVTVTFTDFYKLMKEAAKCELLMNAVNCDLHPMYI